MENKNQPLVSVIMNCYNGEKYLREAIDSVYAQTYQNWEIIFWDNASTDTSAEITNTYDSKLRYFKGEKTIPLGAARNKALEHCNGEFIAFLDVDDMWLPEKLELQMQEIQETPESIVCYSDGYDLYENRNIKKKIGSSKNVKFYEGDIFDKLIITNFINWQTVLVKKDLALDELYFNEKLTFSEDHEILLRLSLKGGFKFCSAPLIYYRIHENNMSNNYQLILEETEGIFDLFDKEIIERNIDLKNARALLYGSIVIKLIIANNNDYKLLANYLIKYSNIQNIFIYVLIKLSLASIIRVIHKII